MDKRILYIDMDNTLVNFKWGITQLDPVIREKYADRLDEIPGFFSDLPPIKGAIQAYHTLSDHFDTYILSTAPWENPSAWSDKLLWVKRHLPDRAYKRLILSHNKHLNHGDFLIDDRTANGAGDFRGEHIQFGEEPFKSWSDVTSYLMKQG
jgi:5'-nucleotidase